MDKINKVKTKDFEEEVLNAKEPVLVDFYATWCPPCKMLSPILEELAEEFKDKIKFVKVDVDEEYSLAERYGIRGVPTLMLFKDGIVKDVVVGLIPKGALKTRVKQIAGV